MENEEREQEKPFSATAIMNREELDVQISTAKKFPRSIVAFKRLAEEMATIDEETAGSMFYMLPRAGKRIEGPSVRLAEIVGSAWGNVRYDGRVIEVQERYVVAQGTCLDLERNTGARVEVRRRITNKEGRRYDDDMITVTANAAVSIALRQCIFKVVPFAYIKGIYERAKEVAIGKGLTMEQRRTRAFDWFAKVGAKPENLFKILDRKGLEDITVDDLVALQGMKNAISDGEITWEAILRDFDTRQEPEKKGPALEKLKESLRLATEMGQSDKAQSEDREPVKRQVGRPRLSEEEKAARQASKLAAQPSPEPPPSPTDQGQVSWKQRLLLWIESVATHSEIFAIENFVTENLKKLTAQEQIDVCLAWNYRQKELREAEENNAPGRPPGQTESGEIVRNER